MYILYVLSAIVPSDFYSIKFLLIFYNNCLDFEIISDTQKPPQSGNVIKLR
ncbi:hypothetical protein COPCOM_02377 [Coprococcus comes ATCC 27758]|uniref:Uncharacterized protein n=1 Tax=Coprococcus comes ATCC 27758 TaxID=470146 RepID=C0BBC1_9FIRM|nr:hypothetical protein COPCOM_02377 [Coprococcus comes ATCC 27758]